MKGNKGITPYWLDTSHPPQLPALNKDLTVDVVVIGAGITGLTAAYLLKKQGLKVAVLERGRCGFIDTGHTTAHLTCVTDERLHILAKNFGRDHARAAWDAGNAAIDQIDATVRAEGIDCNFAWVPGYLHAPWDPEVDPDLKSLQKDAELAAEFGLRARYLEAVPFAGRPGVEFSNQARFHPTRYINALAKTVHGDGSYVFENSEVDMVDAKPLAIRVAAHQVKCASLVIATHNPLIGKASLVSATLLQTKLALYTSYALGARLPKGEVPEALYWDTNDPYYYLRVDQREDHDFAIFGGEDHKTGQTSDTEAIFQRLRDRLAGIIPAAEVTHHWSGQVIETNDGLPLMGETAENQFAATGYAGNGMTFGTLGGMMAVDYVLKRKNPWAELFDIHRKKLLGGTWNYLAENKDYPYYMVRDWLSGAEADDVGAVPKGEGKVVKVNGKKAAVFRSESDQVTICSAVCTHMKCIVAWNNAEKTWDCPCHGSRFKPTGEVISGPAEAPLPPMKEESKG